MKKNNELFWIFEVLLLTPIALFWVGVVTMYFGSDTLFNSVVGQPYSAVKSIFITVLCPLAAAWFASEYIRENKNEKGRAKKTAKYIIGVSLATLVVVLIYLLGENKIL